VRLLTAADIAGVHAAEVASGELFRTIAEPRIAQCADNAPCPAEALIEAGEQERAWVAVEGDAVIGFAIATIVDGEGHLDEVAVAPSHGRRGVGRALVEQVEAWTVAQGLTSVTLTTFSDVPWNAPYYERLGYRVVTDLSPALQAVVDEQATWGLDPTLRVVMRRAVSSAGRHGPLT
jgi:ribosomal protein S18 acetylase RimI-like enzyme